MRAPPRALCSPPAASSRTRRAAAAGQIYEANGPILDAQLRSAGAEVERLPAVADDEDAHRRAIARGLEADVLLTTGGVSVGVHDLVRQVEAELGVREVFWGVAVKPGKPISFGVREGRLVFGLPGNPVSALVGFELFVRPAVRALQGAAERGEWERGRLAESLRVANPGRDELVVPGCEWTTTESPSTPWPDGSPMIARAAGAGRTRARPARRSRGDGRLFRALPAPGLSQPPVARRSAQPRRRVRAAPGRCPATRLQRAHRQPLETVGYGA